VRSCRVAPLDLLVVGLVVGSSNVAVALALGALGQARRWLRIVVAFGLAETLVPFLGILAGRRIAHALGGLGELVGALVLGAMGAAVVVMAWRDRGDDERLARRASTWGGIVTLALVLAADNLVVGLALGIRGSDALQAALVIGAAAVAFTLLGLFVGSATRRRWERIASVGSGLALIAVAAALGLGWL
jgi:manganese efflux pump family protein